MDVLFICKYLSGAYGDYNTDSNYDYPNCAYGLWNSAKFMVNFLTSVNISSELVTAIDANSIDKLVTENNPKIVVLEALWVTPAKIQELIELKRHHGRIWIIRTHSEWPFLSNEGIAIDWISAYGVLQKKHPSFLYIGCNTEDMSKTIQRFLNVRTLYLPNVYHPNNPEVLPKNNTVVNNTINIGCFGALRPLKNNLIQALAAIKIAETMGYTVNFHINSTNIETDVNPTLKNIRALFKTNNKHILTEHEWETHSAFVETVSTMNFGLQISFTETFNIVAADFVWNGVPIIGSSAIYWLPEYCKVRSEVCIEDIVEKSLHCWYTQQHIVLEEKAFLSLYNDQASNIWENILINLGV